MSTKPKIYIGNRYDSKPFMEFEVKGIYSKTYNKTINTWGDDKIRWVNDLVSKIRKEMNLRTRKGDRCYELIIEMIIPPEDDWDEEKKKRCKNGKTIPVGIVDNDNCSKLIMDLLSKRAMEDDKQVTRLIVDRFWGEERKLIIRLNEFQPPKR